MNIVRNSAARRLRAAAGVAGQQGAAWWRTADELNVLARRLTSIDPDTAALDAIAAALVGPEDTALRAAAAELLAMFDRLAARHVFGPGLIERAEAVRAELAGMSSRGAVA